MVNNAHASRTKAGLRWAGSLLTLVLLVYLFSRQGWAEILAAIGDIPWWHIVLAFALTLVSRLAVAGRWFALLRVSAMDISIKQVMQLTFSGLFAANFLPTTVGGDVIRFAGAVQLKFDGAVSAASLVVDRLVGLFGMALAVPLGAQPLWAWLVTERGWRDLFSGAPMMILTVGDKGLSQRVRRAFARLVQAFALWKDQPSALLASLGMTIIHMLCLYASIAILLGGMNDPMPLWLVAGLWSFVYLVTLLPISINGYGVQEISMTLIFSHVGGISMQSGLTIAILIRTLQMIASLPGAVFVPAILAGIRESEKADV